MRESELGAACIVDGQTGEGADSGPQFFLTIRQLADSTPAALDLRQTEDGNIRITQQVFLTSS